MAEPALADSLRKALRALGEWLSAEAVPSALIGGIAVSLVSRPRTTKDIDVLAFPREDRLETFLRAGAIHGIVPRIADAIAFAARSRVLLLHHEPTGVPIDLALGALAFEREVVERAVRTPLGGFDFPIASPADLVILKAVAHRPIDAADIDAILSTTPGIDLKAIRATVQAFAELLETPGILEDFDRVASRPRRLDH